MRSQPQHATFLKILLINNFMVISEDYKTHMVYLNFNAVDNLILLSWKKFKPETDGVDYVIITVEWNKVCPFSY